MVNVFSGQLANTFFKDSNVRRIETFNIGAFSKTILQQSEQAQREDSTKNGMEFQQAFLADLQTKLADITEKLNNLHRRYIENQNAFRRVNAEDTYSDTSQHLNKLESVTVASGASGHPAGPAGSNIVPYDDPNRLRNFPWNPFWGSKAVDQSAGTLNRTFWQQPGSSMQDAYTENGAFWSSMAYIWGWDVDRINAAYTTTDERVAASNPLTAAGGATFNTVQVNITALQPNRGEMPPLRVGDRIPIVPRSAPAPYNTTPSNGVAIQLNGIRPGGIDYSHASTSAGTDNTAANPTGANSLNYGYEFDDLPLALEVTSTTTLPDGTTSPDGYRVVYSIPNTHPYYNELKVLDGTEPQIIDAPTKLTKRRHDLDEFQYLGTTFLDGASGLSGGTYSRTYPAGSSSSSNSSGAGTTGYGSYPLFFSGSSTLETFDFTKCHDITLLANTTISFKYSMSITQPGRGSFIGDSPSDEGQDFIPNYGSHNWSRSGTVTNVLAGSLTQLGASELTGVNDPVYTELAITPPEEWMKVYFTQQGTNGVRAHVRVRGDITNFNLSLSDVVITTYGGTANGGAFNAASWEQGTYSPLTPTITTDVPIINTISPLDVINKYSNNEFEFTQFRREFSTPNDTTEGDAVYDNILRSPWEMGLLNIGSGSQIGGEMWLDLNGRRLNLDQENIDDGPNGNVSNTGFDTGTGAQGTAATLGVAKAYDFIVPNHPEDALCGSDNTHYGTKDENDPYTDNATTYTTQVGQANTLVPLVHLPLIDINPVSGIPDDARRGTDWGFNSAGFQGTNYDTGGNLDVKTSEADRVAGYDNIQYTVNIPTTDVNLLQNNRTNEVLFNFGSIEDRDWFVSVQNPFVEYRTIDDYVSVSRYRVDEAGNIFDRFGTTSGEQTNATTISKLYDVGSGAKNGQISNDDGSYSSWANYDPNAHNVGHDRMSTLGDDFNMFDYVNDFEGVDPLDTNLTGALLGEEYVGSFPSNRYYYREALDAATAGPAAAGNADKKPFLSFDAKDSNPSGSLAGTHTVVGNSLMPSWANVLLGYCEQDPKYNNLGIKTSSAYWLGLPGFGEDLRHAQGYSAAAGVTAGTEDEIVGSNPNDATEFNDNGTITVEMGNGIDVNAAGHLLVYEQYIKTLPDGSTETTVEPHTIPLPLKNNTWAPDTTGPEPYVPTTTAQTYTFDSYAGKSAMSRTGSVVVSDLATWGDALGVDFNGNGSPTSIFPLFRASKGIVVHADSVGQFDTYNPASPNESVVYLADDQTKPFRVVYADQNAKPATLILVPINAADLPEAAGSIYPPTDTQIRNYAPSFDVEVVNGSQVKLTYHDNATYPTGVTGKISQVSLSNEMDRVSTGVGDDPRTTATETKAIAPEVFNSPHGYVQGDALIALNLVGQDNDSNPRPRRLRRVITEVNAGQQIIPGSISQSYDTQEPGAGYSPSGTWPMAIYDGDRLLNPTSATAAAPLDIMVGHFQGIDLANGGDGSPGNGLAMASVVGFKIGDKVIIDGMTRIINDIVGSTLEFDQALPTPVPNTGVVNLANINGDRELKMFLNKSFTMSQDAPIKITLEYEEYDVSGYPPVATATGNIITENIGFTDATPSSIPQFTDVSYEADNYLVAGKGKTGGSFENEFTTELKRILDNPEYKDVFRMNLMKNVFISASVNDPFNDVISSKILLEWDRLRRRVSIEQTSFQAFYKSI